MIWSLHSGSSWNVAVRHSHIIRNLSKIVRSITTSQWMKTWSAISNKSSPDFIWELRRIMRYISRSLLLTSHAFSRSGCYDGRRIQPTKESWNPHSEPSSSKKKCVAPVTSSWVKSRAMRSIPSSRNRSRKKIVKMWQTRPCWTCLTSSLKNALFTTPNDLASKITRSRWPSI